MLVHIAIKNLAIVKKVDLALEKGLTAITGETGAGKSIALDALGLCLGHRAESNMVREGSDKAEVVAHFDIANVPKAKSILIAHELLQDDNPDECFIRRVVSPEGRSKAFINGIPVNLTQLKELGASLALIHSQHAHYQFLKSDYQRDLLDEYAQHNSLLANTYTSFKEYKSALHQLNELKEQQQYRLERSQLLAYQVQELDEFSVGENEFSELETSFKKLNNTQALVSQSQSALFSLKDNDDVSALDLLNKTIKQVEDIASIDDNVQDILEALQGAQVQAEEAANDLAKYLDNIESDPETLAEIESRYSKCMDLARKHQVEPELLFQTHMQLSEEYQSLIGKENNLASLEHNLAEYLTEYKSAAKALNESRVASAKQLSNEIELSVREMNLPHAQVNVNVISNTDAEPTKLGDDQVQILLSVNPGQKQDLMEKVVSGGELSRLGLALQVISSKEGKIPTMVFDEVDTGISGPTAALVGKLLRKLGTNIQVVCVTHLPQVAASAHNQLFVSKVTDGITTETQLLKLTKQERVNEIARLLAGDELTKTAIANAKDLLKS